MGEGPYRELYDLQTSGLDAKAMMALEIENAAVEAEG
jgi:hypothetical protein